MEESKIRMNTIDFKFKYPGETEEETFEYDIPDEIIIAGVKKYIKDTFNVRIVGEDGDVWRMCFGIGKTYGDDDEFSELFDEAVDAEENWFREKLKDQAFEAFKDEWEAEHGGINESLNEGDGDESESVSVGDKVRIVGTDDVWEGKTGNVQAVNGSKAEVLVDFIPDDKKKTIQIFPIDKLERIGIIDGISESLKEEKNMGKIIYETDWNGKHYTFENEFHSTGVKNHDVLIMNDGESEYKGETTWINRPWHKFDLEEAWEQIAKKAFGEKAYKMAVEINQGASSVTGAIAEFFSKLKPEDVSGGKETAQEADKKTALAKYLGVDPSELSDTGKDAFEYDGATYEVLTDDEADDELEYAAESLWDGMGLEGVDADFKEWILDNALDEDFYRDYVTDMARDEVDNMYDEELVSACVDADLIKEKDAYDEDGDVKDDVDIEGLRDKLVDAKVDETIENMSPSEYFGDYDITDIGIDHRIDKDKIIEYIKDSHDVDGRGSLLAYYDGVEHDLGGDLYAYRIF